MPANPKPEMPLKELGKFSASLLMASESWRLLMKDKEVLFFPIASSLTLFFLLAAFLGIVWTLDILGLVSSLVDSVGIKSASAWAENIVYYSSIFSFYLASSFITTFFNIGLTAVVHARIKKGDITFMDGVKKAFGIVGKIFVWSMISATIGVVLRMFTVIGKSKFFEKIFGGLLSTGWDVLTFFISPTLLLDQVSAVQSIKNSGIIFKKTWGETLITRFSLESFISLLFVSSLFIFGLLLEIFVIFGFEDIPLLVFVVFFIAYSVLLFTVTSSLNAICRVVLYEYARDGIVASGFTPELIYGSIKNNKTT